MSPNRLGYTVKQSTIAVVNGTGHPGATISLFSPNGSVINTTTVASDGTWSFVSDILGFGTSNFTVQQDYFGSLLGPVTAGNVTFNACSDYPLVAFGNTIDAWAQTIEVADGDGSVFIGGSYRRVNLTWNVFDLPSDAGAVAIVARVDPLGCPVWVSAYHNNVTFRGVAETESLVLAATSDGGLYVGGLCHGPMFMTDGIVLQCSDSPNFRFGGDMWIAKLDGATGSIIWAQSYAVNDTAWLIFSGIALDGCGDLILTGEYHNGSTTIAGRVLPYEPFVGANIFIAKLDTATKDFVWASYISSGKSVYNRNPSSQYVRFDSFGLIYIGLQANGDIDVNGEYNLSATAMGVSSSSSGQYYMFKLNQTGSVQGGIIFKSDSVTNVVG